MAAEQVPSVGRIVHYILESGPHAGAHRPAIIVRVWSDSPRPETSCQLQVFTDGDNDGLPPMIWASSRQQGDRPGTWHWPEFVPPVEA